VAETSERLCPGRPRVFGMVRAIGTACVGIGLTLASTFASSLGLSIHAQRIGFGIGAILILLGAALGFSQWRRRGSEPEVRPEPTTVAFESYDESVQEIEGGAVVGFDEVGRSHDRSRQSFKNPSGRRNQTPEDS
jgi:hypothetical protein